MNRILAEKQRSRILAEKTLPGPGEEAPDGASGSEPAKKKAISWDDENPLAA